MYIWFRILLTTPLFIFVHLEAKHPGADAFEEICTSPRIYVCDRFLSDEECDHLIKIARPSLERTLVVDLSSSSGNNLVNPNRTSLGTWISASIKDKIIKKLQSSIAAITEIAEENGEDIQVLYYPAGAEYKPHYDYFDPNTPGGLVHYNRGGQRVATFMVYLNTVEEGGETIFPRARIKIKPEKGKALLFYNVDREGHKDKMSLHGGAPVLQGEKWIMTRWLRERAFH